LLITLDVNGPIFRKKKRGAKIAGLIRVKTKKANIQGSQFIFCQKSVHDFMYGFP
jgi:hypothetical protein